MLQLKLQGLHVYDSINDYTNPAMRYILTSNPKSLLSEEVLDQIDDELISISLAQIGEGDLNYKNVNLQVDITFGTLQAVLKPLVLAKVLQFVIPKNQARSTKKKQEDVRVQVLQTQMNTASESILIKVHVQIKSVRALLVHRFTQLPLAEINIQRTEIEFSQQQDEMILKGTLGNLQLIDTTNYPITLYEETSYKHIKPVQLIGVKDSQSSLLSIDLRLLSEGSSKIKEDNVSIFLDLRMHQIIINYMQQPVLRLIDYTL